jgi:predicted RNA binding protein YcfA (HicA-like mRNA interferase family)
MTSMSHQPKQIDLELLAGFSPDEIALRLKRLGFQFDRLAAGCHEIWYNANNQRYTTIPYDPNVMPAATLKAILKEAGVSLEQFLK